MTDANMRLATGAWGAEPPDWIVLLAIEADRTTQTAAAGRIGYAHSVVHQVLRRNYKGRYDKVEAAVRGALLGALVHCPGYGCEIDRAFCLAEQRRPFAATSPTRVRVWRACRDGCPNYRPPSKKGDVDAE